MPTEPFYLWFETGRFEVAKYWVALSAVFMRSSRAGIFSATDDDGWACCSRRSGLFARMTVASVAILASG